MELSSPKSRLAALLFVLFLGGLGAHRFYVGKIITGIFQLVLTCTVVGMLISGPWVFIDLIFIIAGGFKDKQGRKLTDWNPERSRIRVPHDPSDLEKYAQLRDKGILTEEEFQAKKKEFLGK